MDIPEFVYPFINSWNLGYFQVWAIMNNGNINIYVHVLCCNIFLFLLGIKLEMKLLAYNICLV